LADEVDDARHCDEVEKLGDHLATFACSMASMISSVGRKPVMRWTSTPLRSKTSTGTDVKSVLFDDFRLFGDVDIFKRCACVE
jgi:hypothetical protein